MLLPESVINTNILRRKVRAQENYLLSTVCVYVYTRRVINPLEIGKFFESILTKLSSPVYLTHPRIATFQINGKSTINKPSR